LDKEPTRKYIMLSQLNQQQENKGNIFSLLKQKINKNRKILALIMSNRNEEKDLLNGLFADDENSARLFFKRYGGLIRYAIRSIRLRSDAIKEEDLFNESVVHLLDNNKKVLKKFKGDCSLPSYLYTVCRRHTLSIAKRENPVTKMTGDDTGLTNLAEEIFDEETFSDDEKEVVQIAFDRLDKDSQIFIKMAVEEKRPVEETMQFLGLKNPNFVYKKKFKLIEKMRKIVKKLLVNKKLKNISKTVIVSKKNNKNIDMLKRKKRPNNDKKN
jgi:hypothetical protein